METQPETGPALVRMVFATPLRFFEFSRRNWDLSIFIPARVIRRFAGALGREKLLRKSLIVFRCGDERLDHLGIDEVAIELVELVEPELIAGVIRSGFRRVVGVTAEITEVLHQHERAIEFGSS